MKRADFVVEEIDISAHEELSSECTLYYRTVTYTLTNTLLGSCRVLMTYDHEVYHEIYTSPVLLTEGERGAVRKLLFDRGGTYA